MDDSASIKTFNIDLGPKSESGPGFDMDHSGVVLALVGLGVSGGVAGLISRFVPTQTSFFASPFPLFRQTKTASYASSIPLR